MNQNSSKFINFTLTIAVLLAIFLWTTVSQNASSDTAVTTCEVDFLDVGQGDAILVNLPQSVQVLIDGGPDSRVLNQLAHNMPKFDKKIEYVFASHPDADHIGGLPSVLQGYEVGEFIETGKTSDSQVFKKMENEISQKKITVQTNRKGDTVDLSGGAKMEIVWPDENAVKSSTTNNASEVMRLNYQGGTVMFTGDVEVEAMDKIMASEPKDKLKSDILKVAHHGASSAYNQKFLEEVAPSDAVISVGKKNKYGHPTEVILNALKNLNIKIFRTDEMGTVGFIYKNSTWVEK